MKMSEVLSDLRIVFAHDYLTQRGGAERVSAEIVKGLRPEYVFTSAYEPDATFPEFERVKVKTSWLNRIPMFRHDPRRALPFLALVWSLATPVDADVLVCSSSGWAHALRTTNKTRKIVYCHNPARWLYQTEDYELDLSLSARLLLRALRRPLRVWDRRAASSADLYLANSSSVAERIREAYGREPTVLFPPVSIDVDGPREPVPGVELPFFLSIGRARGYKGTTRLIEAFGQLPLDQLVTVGGYEVSSGLNIRALGRVSDAQLRWLYANARALISVSREDFGLTPIEANAFGTPVLVIRAGGFLDTTAPGVSGCFIESDTVAGIAEAVSAFPAEWQHDCIVAHAACFSRETFNARLQEHIASVCQQD